jgi:hypothetical protein
MKKYDDKEYEKNLKDFYDSISERDQRNLIGLHFSILGPGSEQYISDLFGCDINIIHDCKKNFLELSTSEKDK